MINLNNCDVVDGDDNDEDNGDHLCDEADSDDPIEYDANWLIAV